MAKEWNVYRDENGVNHLPGPNAGGPLTSCKLDAGSMTKHFHDPNNAATWCADCFKKIAEDGGNMAEEEKEGETVQDHEKEGRPAPSIEKNTGGGTSGSIQGGAGNAPGESGGESS